MEVLAAMDSVPGIEQYTPGARVPIMLGVGKTTLQVALDAVEYAELVSLAH